MTLSPAMRSRLVRTYLRYLARTDRPIVLGPFRSEVGFEVLYWIPFLSWAQKRYGISPERCLALTRGGMGHLYPAKHVIDLYELRAVDAVRIENQVDYEQRKMLKQSSVTMWDRLIAEEAVAKVFGAGTRFHLLHPSWMYWLFQPVWDDQTTLQHVATHTDYSPMPVPPLPDGLTLPKEFVAVRFYERATFPLTDPVMALARDMVTGLASRYPVVLLNSGLFADDHVDLPVAGPNIVSLPKVAPEMNLALQAAVLARASAFVGTYGGVAQWALRYGKPSLSFYAQFNGTAFAHRTLSELLAARMGVPFECADLRAIKLTQAVVAPVTIPGPEASSGVAVIRRAAVA